MQEENTEQLDLFASEPAAAPTSRNALQPARLRPVIDGIQPTFSEISDEYRAFEEKFKPKKTTDDCYTPDLVYRSVRDYVCTKYGIDPASIVRPFYPGGDYERQDYPDGCLVLDNPPFSILANIVRFYCSNRIRFFLFAPALTVFGPGKSCTAICAGAKVTYENGANVNTSFLTNLEDPEIVAMSDPVLHDLIEEASRQARSEQIKKITKLTMPDELITATRINWYSMHGTQFVLRRKNCFFCRELDNYPSGPFGGGYFLSEKAATEKAAAEKAAATRIELSERERAIIAHLSALAK